jgi:hypothetical protein
MQRKLGKMELPSDQQTFIPLGFVQVNLLTVYLSIDSNLIFYDNNNKLIGSTAISKDSGLVCSKLLKDFVTEEYQVFIVCQNLSTSARATWTYIYVVNFDENAKNI